MPELTDKIQVLIEKYNTNPKTPIKADTSGRYSIEFVIDKEKVYLHETHRSKRRDIEIRVGTTYYSSFGGDLDVAVLKVEDNGKKLGNPNLRLLVSDTTFAAYDFEVESAEHQLKCLEIGLGIIRNLYNLYNLPKTDGFF